MTFDDFRKQAVAAARERYGTDVSVFTEIGCWTDDDGAIRVNFRVFIHGPNVDFDSALPEETLRKLREQQEAAEIVTALGELPEATS